MSEPLFPWTSDIPQLWHTALESLNISDVQRGIELARTTQQTLVPNLVRVRQTNAQPSRPRNRFARIPAVEFHAGNAQGIRLFDALQNNFSDLVNPYIEVMEAVGDKVSYIIEWPGYPPLKKQMNVRRKKGVQSRSRIAQQVAEMVEAFIEDTRNYISSKPKWQLGQGCMVFENLYLVEVKRISKATWAVGLAVAS
ncbi:hypothetical protein BC629DRAFT_565782 [Irpex lacteus]|nr:hypothetical protein BC629DRAFT_565782 [Irpex lacteus]